MEIRLSYIELQDYVAAHFGKEVTLGMLSPNGLRAKVAQNVLFGTVHAEIHVTVAEVGADFVVLDIGGGGGMRMILNGLVAFLRKRLHSDAVQVGDGRRITVRLSRIERCKALTDALILKGICFTENGMDVYASLKN
ncbi:MAG: hypothetical protein K2F63_04540 [Muribaculaceae bacterium]|nr:hypothetical protein [Muribaculaceae bacterium]MDE6135148.1 hypothetical protein [Muribaculaceae bacterium]